MPIFYLYRHIRHDLNVPFYVGMGTVKKDREYSIIDTTKYGRAFSRKNRNRIWSGIVSKTTHDVEIVYETDSKIDIFNKEKEFIKLYGRIDNKEGTLANLTDGGDGSTNLSKSVIRKTVDKNWANGCFERHGIRLAKMNRDRGNSFKGKERPEGYAGFRELYVYSNIDGKFIAKYNSRRDASKAMNLSINWGSYIDKGRSVRGYRLFNSYQGIAVKTIPNGRNKKVFVINIITGENKIVASLNDAARLYNLVHNTLCQNIKDKKIIDGNIFSYSETVNISEYTQCRKTSPRGIRKTTCSKCGDSKQNLQSTYCNKCNSERTKSYQKIKNELKRGS